MMKLSFLSLALCSSLLVPAFGEVRPFSLSGKKAPVSAEIVTINGDEVVLATSKGKLASFKKSAFSAADQEWMVKNEAQIRRDGLNQAKIALKKSAKSLNVIYFLGNDREPIEGYERRLSELLLHLQQFYGKEMARQGFGPRSFGLEMKDAQTVKIIVLKGKQPESHYPYENGGGGRVNQEVEAYFKENPTERKSSHTLVIMPTHYNENNNDKNPGGVPFYGMGKICFALDYKTMDLKHIGENSHEGRLLTKWYGGLAHELGHGLNLPHNHATKTEEKNLGTALMGSGNYSFGMTPTFITPASAAILDTCEVFSLDPKKEFYQGNTPVEVKDLAIRFKEGKISIQGTFSCDLAVKSLNVYVEEPPFGVNRDYEAVNFSQKLGKKKGSFSLLLSKDELIGLNKNDFQVRLMFVLENGKLVSKPFDFKWDDLKDLALPKA